MRDQICSYFQQCESHYVKKGKYHYQDDIDIFSIYTAKYCQWELPQNQQYYKQAEKENAFIAEKWCMV